MTELDPSLVLKAFATPQLDVGNLMETRQQLKLRNLAQAKAERQEADALAAQQRRQTIGQQATTDPTGARQAAAGAGDFDLVQALDKMDEATRKRVTDISRATAPLLMSLKNVAQPERQAALQGMAPALMERGFSESQVQDLLNGDLSDGKLDTLGNQAMTIEEYNKANEAYTLSPGSKRFVGGREIASVPFAPREATIYDEQGNPQVVEYTPGGYDQFRIGLESGGNPNADNPNSSALGRDQFTSGTWLNTVSAAKPAWAQGMTQEQILAQRTNPQRSAEMEQVLRSQNASALQSAGLPQTNSNLYAMHHFGQGGGLKFAQASQNTPVDQIFPAEVIAANPYLRGKTKGEVLANWAGRAGGSPQQSNGPRVIGAGKPANRDAPSGYRFKADGTTLEPIPGGPADKGAPGSTDRKGEADLRKEFNKEPEVKDFNSKRTAWQTIDRLGKAQASRKPTAQNDMALIFSYMKMLDPGSVVREGEFANAQNAAGVPDQIRNAYNKARSGELMNPDQRKNMVNTAATVYTAARDIYNPIAQKYQGYASDYGLNPNRVAQEYKPTSPKVTGQGGNQGGGNIPTLTVEQARAAKPGTRFRGSDGVVRVKQ